MKNLKIKAVFAVAAGVLLMIACEKEESNLTMQHDNPTKSNIKNDKSGGDFSADC